MEDVVRAQYELIRSTRQTLFTFLSDIPFKQLHVSVANFGSGSIIQTHIHVADCYLYWLGAFGLHQTDFSFADETKIENADVREVQHLFHQVDEIVNRFLDTYDSRWLEPLQNTVRFQPEPLVTTPLWLLTHTETHEFHHKGQIVSMARSLGYVPPDTDLMI